MKVVSCTCPITKSLKTIISWKTHIFPSQKLTKILFHIKLLLPKKICHHHHHHHLSPLPRGSIERPQNGAIVLGFARGSLIKSTLYCLLSFYWRLFFSTRSLVVLFFEFPVESSPVRFSQYLHRSPQVYDRSNSTFESMALFAHSWFVLHNSALLITYGQRIFSMRLRHLMTKTWILFSIVDVILQVSQPYSGTEMQFVLKDLSFRLLVSCLEFHMLFSEVEAWCALYVFIGSSILPHPPLKINFNAQIILWNIYCQ